MGSRKIEGHRLTTLRGCPPALATRPDSPKSGRKPVTAGYATSPPPLITRLPRRLRSFRKVGKESETVWREITRLLAKNKMSSVLVQLTPDGLALIDRPVKAHVKNERRILASIKLSDLVALDIRLP